MKWGKNEIHLNLDKSNIIDHCTLIVREHQNGSVELFD